jgi:hypothetical protein
MRKKRLIFVCSCILFIGMSCQTMRAVAATNYILGTNTVNTSSSGFNLGFIFACMYACSNTGTVNRIVIYVSSLNLEPSIDIRVALYAEDLGNPGFPGDLLSESNVETISATGLPRWVEFPIPDCTVSPGSNYFICYQVNHPVYIGRLDINEKNMITKDYSTFTNYPNPFGSYSGVSVRNLCMWAGYSDATPTIGPTFSATPTRTLTPVFSSTSTFTHTPTATRTPTFTHTPTFTSTLTSSPTVSIPTPTSTPTRTVSTTATKTITPTLTVSPTASIPIPTVSNTATSSGLPQALLTDKFLAYPNPARDETAYFYFNLDSPARVKIVLYNVLGEKGIELEGDYSAGPQIIEWDIRQVSPGIYSGNI